MEYTPFIWPFVISLFATMSLGIYAVRHRDIPTVTTFTWLMVALTFWTFCYLMELSSSSLAGKSFWLAAKYPGSAVSPILWFILSLQLTKHDHWLTKPILIGLGFFAVSTCLIVFTNSLHHWFWTDIRLVSGFPETEVDHGFYFWVYAAIPYSFVLTSVILFFQYYRTTPSYYRRQATLMAFGGFVPLGGRILEDAFGFDLFPKVDNVIVLLLLSSICFALAMFRYGALNIIHIAHNLVISNIEAGIIVLDPLQRVVELNPYARDLVGTTYNAAIGKSLNEALTSWPDVPIVVGVEQEIIVQHSGESAIYSLQSSLIRETNGAPVGYVLVLFDITARKTAERQLEHLARMDVLTGVTNRRYFYEMAEIEWARAQRYAHPLTVVMVDIDYFKQVNDRYGHHAGDEVLKFVAAECQRHMRTTDLFARYGGEEFICMFSEGGHDGALNLAERLRHTIAHTHLVVDGHTIQITLSLGIAHQASTESIPLDELIKRADQALYLSKANGRNRITVAG
jgi:diguanylate cyclase (GGDEF)-like protein/PAS domain S-box-containing protein